MTEISLYITRAHCYPKILIYKSSYVGPHECIHVHAQTLTISIYSQTLTVHICTLVRTYSLCGPQQLYLCNKMSILKGHMEHSCVTNLVQIRGTHFQYGLPSSSNCFAADDLEMLQWCHLQCHR